MSGGRMAVAAAWAGAPGTGKPSGPIGTLCPRPTMDRPSPDVGRNQWNFRLTTNLLRAGRARRGRRARHGVVELAGHVVGDLHVGRDLPGLVEGVGQLLLGGDHRVVD